MTYIPFGKYRKMHRNTTLIEVTFLFTVELSRLVFTYKMETFQLRWRVVADKAPVRRKRRSQRSWRFQHTRNTVFGRDTFTEHPAQVLGVEVFLFTQVKELWNCALPIPWEKNPNKQSKPAWSWFRMVLNLALGVNIKAVITGRWKQWAAKARR